MMPFDTEMPIPYGFPIAKTLSPTLIDSLSAKSIELTCSKVSALIFKIAISEF